MAIGDVHSDKRGSGARFNSGKPAMSLLPLSSVAASYDKHPAGPILCCLADWQEGRGVEALEMAAQWLADLEGVSMAQMWADCARVFEYGRDKYAAWNWAKGMAWSIPLECAVRHLLFGIMAGESVDAESGHPHRGHFMCNLAMLTTFARTYPEGDDRPIQWLTTPAAHALDLVEMSPPAIPDDTAGNTHAPPSIAEQAAARARLDLDDDEAPLRAWTRRHEPLTAADIGPNAGGTA